MANKAENKRLKNNHDENGGGLKIKNPYSPINANRANMRLYFVIVFMMKVGIILEYGIT